MQLTKKGLWLVINPVQALCLRKMCEGASLKFIYPEVQWDFIKSLSPCSTDPVRAIALNCHIYFRDFFFFWLHPWNAEVPEQGIEAEPQQWTDPQQWPDPQQWQQQILNLLSHQGTPYSQDFCVPLKHRGEARIHIRGLIVGPISHLRIRSWAQVHS